MRIRQATIEDAERIRELTIEHTVNRNSTTPGFVEFDIPSLEEYRRRAQQSPYIAVLELDGIQGFIAGYPNEMLTDWQCPIAQRLAGKQRPFVYVEQIVVAREQRHGHASTLFSRLALYANQTIYGAAAVQNTASQQFMKKQGGQFCDEIITRSGLIFRIYKKELG
ncbi:hypothetical protein HY489_00550 [Candidatus Woesearchaeota archaeon]|nr:hypothetical protein [Candidatus Woesearchaeota archaeon]